MVNNPLLNKKKKKTINQLKANEEKCQIFSSTSSTWTVMLSTDSNIQSHPGVSSVAKVKKLVLNEDQCTYWWLSWNMNI